MSGKVAGRLTSSEGMEMEEEHDDGGETNSSVTSSEGDDEDHDLDPDLSIDEEEDEEDESLGTGVLIPSSSVVTMCETVGVTISPSIAALIGYHATQELKNVLKIAKQFARHEKDVGVCSSHFTKAEELVTGQVSLGHNSDFEEPTFVPITKGLSVLSNDKPEIDLIETIKSPSTHVLVPAPPPILRLSVIHSACGRRGSSTWSAQGHDHQDESQGMDLNINGVTYPEGSKLPRPIHPSDLLIAEPDDNTSPSNPVVIHKRFDRRDDESSSSDDEDDDGNHGPSLAKHWEPYLITFVKVFLARSDPNEHSRNCKEGDQLLLTSHSNQIEPDSPDFQAYLKDIRTHGIFSVLEIISDFFKDYMRDSYGPHDTVGLSRILAVFRSVLVSDIKPSRSHLLQMFGLMIDLLVLPCPFEIQLEFSQIIILLLKKSSDSGRVWTEILHWICCFITDFLSQFISTCGHNFGEKAKILSCVLHIANALDEIGIRLAFSSDWHNLVLKVAEIFLVHIEDINLEVSEVKSKANEIPSDSMESPQTHPLFSDALKAQLVHEVKTNIQETLKARREGLKTHLEGLKADLEGGLNEGLRAHLQGWKTELENSLKVDLEEGLKAHIEVLKGHLEEALKGNLGGLRAHVEERLCQKTEETVPKHWVEYSIEKFESGLNSKLHRLRQEADYTEKIVSFSYVQEGLTTFFSNFLQLYQDMGDPNVLLRVREATEKLYGLALLPYLLAKPMVSSVSFSNEAVQEQNGNITHGGCVRNSMNIPWSCGGQRQHPRQGKGWWKSKRIQFPSREAKSSNLKI